MRRIMMIMAVLMMLCPDIYASEKKAEESPAVQVLTSNKNAKKLEGGMLKLARPVLKKTPMAVVMDDIDMMVMYSISQKADEKEKQFAQQAINVLEKYNKVSEIDDPDYRMSIYIDNPVGENFSEIILYTSRPDASIMVFVGNFTIGSLKKVGEISDQRRMERRQAKH